MPVRHRVFKSLPVALLSLSATFALSIALFGCGVSSTANEWTWVSGSNSAGASGNYRFAAASNLREARYNWTESSDNLSGGQTYASNPTGQLNRFWEFSPATEIWSWVSGSSTQDKIYLAAMPELSPTDNAWTWVSGSLGAGGSYGTQGLAAASNVPGARCKPVNWIESVASPSPCVGDEMQASLNDYYRYGP